MIVLPLWSTNIYKPFVQRAILRIQKGTSWSLPPLVTVERLADEEAHQSAQQTAHAQRVGVIRLASAERNFCGDSYISVGYLILKHFVVLEGNQLAKRERRW